MSNSRFIVVPRDLVASAWALLSDTDNATVRALKDLLDQPDGWKVVVDKDYAALQDRVDSIAQHDPEIAPAGLSKEEALRIGPMDRWKVLLDRVQHGDLESCPRCAHPSHDGDDCTASPKCSCDYPRGEIAKTPETPKAAPQKVEGDAGR